MNVIFVANIWAPDVLDYVFRGKYVEIDNQFILYLELPALIFRFVSAKYQQSQMAKREGWGFKIITQSIELLDHVYEWIKLSTILFPCKCGSIIVLSE